MVSCCSHCPRLISVSMIAGGHPVALADPETWSLSSRVCDECGALFCDRCAPPELLICPKCNLVMDTPPPDPSLPYVYRKPRHSKELVRPGPGPTDFMEL